MVQILNSHFAEGTLMATKAIQQNKAIMLSNYISQHNNGMYHA